MTSSAPWPDDAQIRTLKAWLDADADRLDRDPATEACIANGWLERSGEHGYRVTEAGWHMLKQADGVEPRPGAEG